MPSHDKRTKNRIKSRKDRKLPAIAKVNRQRARATGGSQYDDSGWNKFK